MSTFQQSLKIEKDLQPEADRFYKDVLGATTIKRYDWDDPLQRQFQQKDIDCSIELYAPGLDVFWLNVSEKFRTADWGDMCIELWWDFEGKKEGWALKGESDMILYTTPSYYVEIWNNDRFKYAVREIMKEYNRERILSLTSDIKRNGVVKVKLNNRFDARLIKVWTEDMWYGISICIPWKTLFYEYYVDINIYDKKGNKISINKFR